MMPGFVVETIFQVEDLILTIIEFLTPQDLYNMFRSSTAILHNPSITMWIIVKLGLLNGTIWHKNTIENLYHNIIADSIHMFTKLRLLFLLSNKNCENCGQRKIKYVSEWSVAYCWACRRICTKWI